MTANTKIEWADHTFNPWVGCTKVSPGCDHCYAEAWAARFKRATWGAGKPRVLTTAQTWRQPLKWNAQAAASQAAWEKFASDWRLSDEELRAKGFVRPRRTTVFCASLADWLDNEVPIEWFLALLDLIRRTPELNWLLLTKRIGNWLTRMEKASAIITDRVLFGWVVAWRNGTPPANVWLGATVVNQEEADRDIPKLLATPAEKRFLSIEPMLGPVDLRALRVRDRLRLDALTGCHSGSAGPGTIEECLASLPRLPGSLPPVDWVIVGGESGPHARPMHPDWARSLRDQCTSAGVPFHFKQWGEWRPISQGDGDWYAHLYRSRRIARDGEKQDALDELWGKTCIVDQLCLRNDGEHAGITERDAWQQGTAPELAFKVGKKAAGRLLDGRTWDEVPE